jgi:integrase
MRAKRLLTQLTVDRVKATGRRYDLPDGPGGVPGLMLRVSERGVKSFALRYRIRDHQPRTTLGLASAMTLGEARAAARVILEQVEQGIDPAAEAEPKPGTVKAVIAAYVAKRLRPRTRTWADVEALLHRDVGSRWGDRPITSITKRDVRDLIEAIAARGSPVVANRVLRYLRGLFRWAIANDYVEADPTTGIDRPHDEKPRERVLTEAEIKAVWQAFDQMAYPFGALGELLLLTGQRRGEWAGARWSEIDFDRAVWTLPASRSKTGVEHLLPLTPEVIEILGTIPRINGSPLIFPSSRLASGQPVSGFSKGLWTVHRLSGTSGWTWHDLRRTCRTGFARLGVTAAVGERLLNHADGTRSAIVAVYDRHSYQPEMSRALELWAAEVDRIVTGTGAKVVPLARSAL